MNTVSWFRCLGLVSLTVAAYAPFAPRTAEEERLGKAHVRHPS